MKTKTKGCFKQETNGTWTIDTKVSINGSYKHFKKRGYRLLSDAKKDFERAKEQFIKENSSKYEIMFFEDLLNEYKKMRKTQVTETTMLSDESLYRVYFNDYFGGKLLKDCFNKENVSNWYNWLIDNALFSTVQKSKSITRIKDILKFAYMHEFIDAKTYQSCDISVYQIKCKKEVQSERVVWTELEEHKFLEATKEDAKDHLMFTIFLVLACRLGEFLALQPQCFDYKKRKIYIKQQVLSIKGKRQFLTDQLKSRESYRTIVLSQQTADLLNDYIQSMQIKNDEFLFFTFNKKEPMSRNTFRRKLYYYCDIADVRKANPHAMRHQLAVKLARVCESGEDLEIAAHRLGHTVSVFMNTYANHKNEEKQDELMERLYKA